MALKRKLTFANSTEIMKINSTELYHVVTIRHMWLYKFKSLVLSYTTQIKGSIASILNICRKFNQICHKTSISYFKCFHPAYLNLTVIVCVPCEIQVLLA